MRSQTAEIDALLRRALAAHFVPGVEAPSNYSLIAPGSAADGRPRGVNILYRSAIAVVRSRTPGRAVRALLGYLGSHADEERDDVLLVRAFAVIAGDVAVLAPWISVYRIDALEPRLARAGLRPLDSPYAALDPATGELVAEEPRLDLDRAALALLDREEPPPVATGRYPVRGWALLRPREDPVPFSRAEAVAETMRSLVNAQRIGGDRALATLERAFAGARLATIGTIDPGPLTRTIAGLAGI